MFCYQCQETSKNQGCTVVGVCGKTADVANLQDLLLYLCKGISHITVRLREKGVDLPEINKFVVDSMFMTITNANFDKSRFITRVRIAQELRDSVKAHLLSLGGHLDDITFDGISWRGDTEMEMAAKAAEVGILVTENEDVRSLRELTIYGPTARCT